MGKPPGDEAGNYTKHLDRKTDTIQETSRHYKLQIAGHRKHDIARSQFEISTLPGHESLHEEIVGDPSQIEKLQHMKENNGLPPTYYDHPTVTSNPQQLVWPFGIYMDGLPYSLTDSVLGVWLVNLVSEKRHLIAVLRKRVVCQCGCRGWCSYFSTRKSF